jgi:transcriptional regulator with XRE-family HTH domain
MDEQEVCGLFGKNIKRYRAQYKWSQEMLAEKLDISTNFLSNLENGKAWVSPKTVAKLSGVLHIEPYELFKPQDAIKDEVKAALAQFSRTFAVSVNQTMETV